jgi:hypothetical protein
MKKYSPTAVTDIARIRPAGFSGDLEGPGAVKSLLPRHLQITNDTAPEPRPLRNYFYGLATFFFWSFHTSNSFYFCSDGCVDLDVTVNEDLVQQNLAARLFS